MEALSSTLFVSKFSETRTVLHPSSSSSSSSSSSCSLIKIPIKRSGSLKIADTSRFLRVCGLPGDVSGDVEGEDASGLVSEESVSSLSEVRFCCKFLRFFLSGFSVIFSLVDGKLVGKGKKNWNCNCVCQSFGLFSGGVGITIVKTAESTVIYIWVPCHFLFDCL